MARRPFAHRPRQASARPNQEFPDGSGEHSSSRLPGQPTNNYDDYDDTRDPLIEYLRRQNPSHHLRPPFRTGCDPLGMQHAVGSMLMWYPQSQNYYPVFNPMQQFNEAPWMGHNYGANSFLAMAHANFPHQPYHHYRQPPWEPRPDFSQLLLPPLPQRNNTPEPATTDSKQQLPVLPSQVPQPMLCIPHPGPAAQQTSQHPPMPSASQFGPYMTGPAPQQATQFLPLTHLSQPEAGLSIQPVQAMAQTPQHAPIYSIPPLSHPGQQQQVQPSTQPAQPMVQAPQYVPIQLDPLPIPTYNYPLPNNGNDNVNSAVGQSTRPTGGPGNQETPPQAPQINWSGRRRGL
jgi:hypothetical protein